MRYWARTECDVTVDGRNITIHYDNRYIEYDVVVKRARYTQTKLDDIVINQVIILLNDDTDNFEVVDQN